MVTVNYSEEMTAELVKLYTEKLMTVEELADHFNKPKRSIIGKLSKEGVYLKKVYKTKGGESPVTKKEMIHNLSKIINADPEKLQGLEKAPKIELEYLIKTILLLKLETQDE